MWIHRSCIKNEVKFTWSCFAFRAAVQMPKRGPIGAPLSLRRTNRVADTHQPGSGARFRWCVWFFVGFYEMFSRDRSRGAWRCLAHAIKQKLWAEMALLRMRNTQGANNAEIEKKIKRWVNARVKVCMWVGSLLTPCRLVLEVCSELVTDFANTDLSCLCADLCACFTMGKTWHDEKCFSQHLQ